LLTRLCRLPVSVAPKWLDGTLEGDAGFDPLGLGTRPALCCAP
jgi:hypothetical protein